MQVNNPNNKKPPQISGSKPYQPALDTNLWNDNNQWRGSSSYRAGGSFDPIEPTERFDRKDKDNPFKRKAFSPKRPSLDNGGSPPGNSGSGNGGGGNGGSNNGGSNNPQSKSNKKKKKSPKKNSNSYNAIRMSEGGSNGGGNGNGNNNNNNSVGGASMPSRNNSNTNRSNRNGGSGGNYNSTDFDGGSGSGSGMSWFGENRYSGSGPNLPGSNLKSGLVYNTAQRPTSAFSPMYIKCGELFPRYTVDTGQSNYFKDIILTDVWSDIYRMVRNTTTRNITSYGFTLSTWYAYTTAVIELLQHYYLYDSVAAYMSDNKNHNVAVRRQYEAITAQGWQEFDRAKTCLSKQFVKPEMVQLVAWLYQIYTPNQFDAGTLYRMSFNNFLNTASTDNTKLVNGTRLRELVDVLYSNENLEVAAYLNRAFPDWRISKLPESSATPIFDRNFLDFWANANCSYIDTGTGGIKYTQDVSLDNESIDYVMHTDEVNGMVMSLASIYNSATSSNGGGMWVPTLLYGDIIEDPDASSLLRYTSGENFSPLNEISGFPCAGTTSAPIYLTSNFSIERGNPSPTKKTIAMSITLMEQACNEAYRVLLYPNTN